MDPARFTLLFQYGRYLLISSSRPGTQPANLQGIWNQHLRAPWSSNYTVNINTEMNYWGAETVNLPEMHEPLFDLIRNLRISGGNTARIPVSYTHLDVYKRQLFGCVIIGYNFSGYP